MRFTYIESMCDPAYFLPLARAVEQAGYDSFAVPDSICYPEHSSTLYPYNADGTRDFLKDRHFLEPFSLIPAMGSVTTRLRFTTFVLKLAIREPVLVAKSASSIAVLTDNRLRFGVGLSPWPEDFEVCRQEWKGRGRRLNEMMEIIRGLTRGGFYQFKGEYYDLPRIKLCPIPTQPIPLLVGGHSDPALRRAVRLGDGWIHAGGDADKLEQMLRRLQELLDEQGRDRDTFEIHVASAQAFDPEGVRRLEEMGVTDLIVGFRDSYSGEADTQSLDEKIDLLSQFAEAIINTR